MTKPIVRDIKAVIAAAHPLIKEFEKLGFKEDDRKQHFEKIHKGKKAIHLAAEQVAVQNAIEYIDELHKVLQAEFDAVRMRLLPDAMEDEHLASPLNVEGVGRVSLSPDLQVNMPEAERPKLFAWLRAKKMGDLIQNTINSSTLKAWAKRRIAEGKALPPSEQLKVTPITRASITRV